MHALRQLEQPLRARRQLRAAQRARLRHALRPQLRHAPRAEPVAARELGGVDGRLEADQALVRLERRLGLAEDLRVGGSGEDVGVAGGLVAALPVGLHGVMVGVG